VKLEWSVFALADRDGIFDYIEADSPRAAVSVDDAISEAARRLIEFPNSGRTGRVAGTRELIVTSFPYILAYVVREDVVEILRVLHGAQQWPDDLAH
jgi:addiction module RelE/StbE family toxin